MIYAYFIFYIIIILINDTNYSTSINIIISRLLFNMIILFFNNKNQDHYLINNIFNIIMINIRFYLFSY